MISQPSWVLTDISSERGACLDERAAIERLQQGDITGLEYLVRTYQSEALRAANVITQDRALAEDVVQDGFLQAYERIETFDPERPFGPWFRRCVVNLALKAAVRRRRHVALADDDRRAHGMLVDRDPGPEERIERKERSKSVREAIVQLTPEQRAAIVLRYYGELTDREAAVEFGRPAGTVKWWLHSARGRLRGLLAHLEADDDPSGESTEQARDRDE